MPGRRWFRITRGSCEIQLLARAIAGQLTEGRSFALPWHQIAVIDDMRHFPRAARLWWPGFTVRGGGCSRILSWAPVADRHKAGTTGAGPGWLAALRRCFCSPAQLPLRPRRPPACPAELLQGKESEEATDGESNPRSYLPGGAGPPTGRGIPSGRGGP